MDHILFWNARGAGSEKFRTAVIDLVRMNKIDFLIICEPRVQFSKAKKTLLKLGFNEFEVREANGFSGGIWMLWNNTKVQITVVDTSFQSISVKVCCTGVQDWLLSGIYASPCNVSRSGLWSYLDNVAARFCLPWMLVGDFNELLSFSDKIGGARCRFGGMQDWVSRNGLIDMGYQGAAYTWTNN